MNKKDALWQNLLNEEKQRLSLLPAEELMSLEPFTSGTLRDNGVVIEYVIWHDVHSEDLEYSSEEEARSLSAQLDRRFGVRRPQRETHSFVLQADRDLLLGLFSRYLAGFALDENGKVVPISDEVLLAYD